MASGLEVHLFTVLGDTLSVAARVVSGVVGLPGVLLDRGLSKNSFAMWRRQRCTRCFLACLLMCWPSARGPRDLKRARCFSVEISKYWARAHESDYLFFFSSVPGYHCSEGDE